MPLRRRREQVEQTQPDVVTVGAVRVVGHVVRKQWDAGPQRP